MLAKPAITETNEDHDELGDPREHVSYQLAEPLEAVPVRCKLPKHVHKHKAIDIAAIKQCRV